MENILNHCLITGGSGMVGSNIHFGYKPTSFEMDITDSNSIDKYVDKIQKIIVSFPEIRII